MIPACFLLEYLRSNKVGDSVTGTGVGLIGTCICLITGIVPGFEPPLPQRFMISQIIELSCFMIAGVSFLFVEMIMRSKLQNQPTLPRCQSVNIGQTTLCIFGISLLPFLNLPVSLRMPSLAFW